MLKKVICLLLSVFLMAGLLAGCGTTPEEAETTPTEAPVEDVVEPDTTPEEPAEPEEPAGPSGNLQIAALEGAYGALWPALVEGFNAVYPDVAVELVIDMNIEDVISPSMQAGEFPDVVHLATGRPLALTETMIKDNALADLSDLMTMTVPGESVTVADKIIPGFIGNSLTTPYPDGRPYLTPTFYDPCGLFYNAALFTEKGWSVPTTWDEMWALGDQAAEEGIALFAYPTAGYFDALFYALLNSVGGPDFFARATSFEEGIWETAEGTQVLDIMTKLASYTDPSVPANANGDNYLKNQQLLLDNKALFIPCGTWFVGEMQDAPKADGFEYGFMALPSVSAGGDRYCYTYFDQAWIPADAVNQDLAKLWLSYLYSDAAAAIFGEYDASISIVGANDFLPADSQKRLFNATFEQSVAAVGGFATTEAVEGLSPNTAFFDPVNSLVSGDKSQEEWQAEIIEANDRLRDALVE